MSMIKCHDCDDVFDTDADPDCWLLITGSYEVPVCEKCREARDLDNEWLFEREGRRLTEMEEQK